MASPRQSRLASRHRALGSALSDWNGMDMAWSYAQNVNLEHVAVRTAAGLFDVSGLKKIHLTGPDAFAVADHLVTRDLTTIYPGKSVYTMILNDDGRITDDFIMFNVGPNSILLVHGSGTGMERLQESAAGKQVSIKFDDDLHDLSLQGPQALTFLDQYTPYDLGSLKYFHHVATTLFDRHCMISRTGYSGERGYEIFCKGDDAGPIWDAILENGDAQGIIPCSFDCFDMIRVEAALLFYPYDMTEENTPWEMGLGFTVSKNKQGRYRGKEGLMPAIGNEKVRTYGIVADSDRAVDADAEIFVGGHKVGKVTQPMYSTISKRSLTMVQINPDLAKPDVAVEIRGSTNSCNATTHPLPFDDPEKIKRTAQ